MYSMDVYGTSGSSQDIAECGDQLNRLECELTDVAEYISGVTGYEELRGHLEPLISDAAKLKNSVKSMSTGVDDAVWEYRIREQYVTDNISIAYPDTYQSYVRNDGINRDGVRDTTMKKSESVIVME